MNHFLVQYLKPEINLGDVTSMLKTQACFVKPVSRNVVLHCSEKGFDKLKGLFECGTDQILSLQDYDVKIINDLNGKDIEFSLEFEGIPEQMKGKVEQSLPENWD